jgi:hypothetical protein
MVKKAVASVLAPATKSPLASARSIALPRVSQNKIVEQILKDQQLHRENLEDFFGLEDKPVADEIQLLNPSNITGVVSPTYSDDDPYEPMGSLLPDFGALKYGNYNES